MYSAGSRTRFLCWICTSTGPAQHLITAGLDVDDLSDLSPNGLSDLSVDDISDISVDDLDDLSVDDLYILYMIYL